MHYLVQSHGKKKFNHGTKLIKLLLEVLNRTQLNGAWPTEILSQWIGFQQDSNTRQERRLRDNTNK